MNKPELLAINSKLESEIQKLKEEYYNDGLSYREEISILKAKCNKYEERMESAESHVNLYAEQKAKLEGEIYGLRNPVGTTLEENIPQDYSGTGLPYCPGNFTH